MKRISCGHDIAGSFLESTLLPLSLNLCSYFRIDDGCWMRYLEIQCFKKTTGDFVVLSLCCVSWSIFLELKNFSASLLG